MALAGHAPVIARAPQEQADVAASHADVLDAALADGDEQARDQAVGRIQRFLQTAGTGVAR
ncbi:hypothetical protein [Streptomyces sp. NPDC029004]|uniref:hypothetical protein n=1 Tax=Streptomyces sp. NPDC029004 TaxID=3154490 RepID=UPI0033E98DAB